MWESLGALPLDRVSRVIRADRALGALSGHAAFRRSTISLCCFGGRVTLSVSVRRKVAGVVVRGQDSALAVTEANRVTLAAADTTKNDGVAILKELARLATWKCNLLFTAPAELEE